MGKNTQRRNIVTIYVRDLFIPVWEEFLKNIEKDKDLVDLRYKKKSGIASVAIMQLIYNYNEDIKKKNNKSKENKVEGLIAEEKEDE